MKRLPKGPFYRQAQRKLKLVRLVVCKHFDITETSLLEKRHTALASISDRARLAYICSVAAYYHSALSHRELSDSFLFPWKLFPGAISGAKTKLNILLKEDMDLKITCEKMDKEIRDILDAEI